MAIEISQLEKIFQVTAVGPVGECPLPEPGRDAPVIENPELLSIEDQPINFDYDGVDNKAERKRFAEMVMAELRANNITKEEALRILNAELN